MTTQRTSRLALAAYAVVGVTAAAGFGVKLFEFTKSFLTGETSFALPGLTVYLFVACGFACLFAWATLNGQFRDVEAPKHFMLEREAALDEGKWIEAAPHE